MKILKLTIHPRSHTMERLKQRLSAAVQPEEIVRGLNRNFNAGVYQEGQEGRERVYVAPLGYFGIIPDIKRPGRHFCVTYYKGLPPSNVEPNAYLEWQLADQE